MRESLRQKRWQFSCHIFWCKVTPFTVFLLPIIIAFITFRDIWVLLFLTCVTLSDAVKVKVLKTKAVGDSGTTFRLKGRCAIKVSEAIPSATLNIQFDKDTFEFEVRNTIIEPRLDL